MSDTTRQDYAENRVRHEEIEVDPALADTLQDIGFQIETFLAPKSFLPGKDPAWALRNIVPQAKGSRVPLGRLGGWVIDTARKVFRDPNGTETESIWLRGDFTGIATDPETGEVTTMRAANAVLPRSMGTMVENHFAAHPGDRVTLDLEIAVEALGRPPGYAYKVTFYPDEAAQAAIKAVLARQEARIARRTPARALDKPAA